MFEITKTVGSHGILFNVVRNGKIVGSFRYEEDAIDFAYKLINEIPPRFFAREVIASLEAEETQ